MNLRLFRRFKHFFAASVLLMLVLQQAYSGTLDPTFGTGGKMTVDFPFSTSSNYDSYGQYVFIQPSGKIVGLGLHNQPGFEGTALGIAFTRLTATGVVDTTFAGGGKTLEWEQTSLISLADAEMLADGRILRHSQRIQQFGLIGATLKRSNVDGFDENFSPDLAVESYAYPGKIAARGDGKTLVIVRSSTQNYRLYLLRLNSDGSRDVTFDGDGVKEIPRISGIAGLTLISMEALPNGKILIAGTLGYSSSTSDSNEIFLLRLDPDGNADRSFGRLGLVRQAFGGQRVTGTELIVQPDNKYLVAGTIKNPDMDALMVRFTQRGRLDYGFGTGGTVVTDFSPDADDGIRGARLASDGQIIAVGFVKTPATSISRFMAARFSTGGTLQAHTLTEFTPSQDSAALDLAIQPDGKIVAIGYTKNPNPSINGNVFAFARYTAITND